MRYDDPKQDKIIQLLVELRKLPPHVARIFVVSPPSLFVDSASSLVQLLTTLLH
jgi:hypothetical protein